jgi:hypothetical protein
VMKAATFSIVPFATGIVTRWAPGPKYIQRLDTLCTPTAAAALSIGTRPRTAYLWLYPGYDDGFPLPSTT